MNQIEAIAVLFEHKGFVAISDKYVMDIGNTIVPGDANFDAVQMGEIRVDKNGKITVVKKRIQFRINKDTLSRKYKILDGKLRFINDKELLSSIKPSRLIYCLTEMAKNNNVAFEYDSTVLYVNNKGTFKEIALYDSREDNLKVLNFLNTLGWELYPKVYSYSEAKSRAGKVYARGAIVNYIRRGNKFYGDRKLGVYFGSMDTFDKELERIAVQHGMDEINKDLVNTWFSFDEDWKHVSNMV